VPHGSVEAVVGRCGIAQGNSDEISAALLDIQHQKRYVYSVALQ
jgi:hypothetical protein